MRLWSLHPKYLDAQGLVALWRETLLAQAVLCGETKGYRHHPQLARFQALSAPSAGIAVYLRGIHAEAEARGYRFDQHKIKPTQEHPTLSVTHGQMAYEWAHLMQKLIARSPLVHERWQAETSIAAHPMFSMIDGNVEAWEKI